MSAITAAADRPENLAGQNFSKLVETTQGSLVSYAMRYAPCPEDAREIAQEAYLKVFCTLRDRQEREHEPVALLYVTARNLAISRTRHLRVVSAGENYVSVAEELRSRSPDAEESAALVEDKDRYLRAVNCLPGRRRQVLRLRIEAGMSQRDIASALEIAESTVEKHLAKGLRQCASLVTGHAA